MILPEDGASAFALISGVSALGASALGASALGASALGASTFGASALPASPCSGAIFGRSALMASFAGPWADSPDAASGEFATAGPALTTSPRLSVTRLGSCSLQLQLALKAR